MNRLATLRLIHQLQKPVLSIEDLEQIVLQDVGISFKLLRYVNSAALGLSRNVKSIKHAIQMVGTERIRVWASQLLMSSFDDKPRELTTTAFTRALMLQKFAVAQGLENPDSYFIVGMFSVVDALLDLDMSTAMELLPFSKQICDALVNHDGPMGAALQCVLSYEAAQWDEVRSCGFSPELVRQCYLEAIFASQQVAAMTA
jgi:EAL and modified HD-GYP domain-containing signal transduction protein